MKKSPINKVKKHRDNHDNLNQRFLQEEYQQQLCYQVALLKKWQEFKYNEKTPNG